jgi:hypothetical protein
MAEKDKEEEEADKKEQEKISKSSFMRRLSPYSKPYINNFFGILGSMV